MSCTSADSFSNLQLFFLAFLFFFFFLLLRICKLTIRGYVAVYSWSLQRTLTGIPLLEKSNRVAIQFGASTWVNSMKLTEAKLYHSLGDGEMNGNSCIFTEMYGHMTQVFSYSGKQRAVKKKNQNEISPVWRCKTGRASFYKPIYCERTGVGVGGSGVFYFKKGRHWLLLDFGIQNTPHTYLPTLINGAQMKKELRPQT